MSLDINCTSSKLASKFALFSVYDLKDEKLILKSKPEANVCIVYCVQLLMMMGVRKLLDFVFTRSELYWLDHILPGEERIRHEDEQIRRYSQVRRPPTNITLRHVATVPPNLLLPSISQLPASKKPKNVAGHIPE